MRILLLILLVIAVLLILVGCAIAVFTWYRSRKDQPTDVSKAAGE